jgi:Na+/H+-dicarboxylate symporter/ABC-type amino acid transport substrate-binding protein
MNASRSTDPGSKPSRRLGFTSQVVLGVGLGILAGLFFGESIAGIGVVGTAYVRLLQMTILPYIMVSLMHGFGGLTREQAVKVAPRLALVMLVFWVLGLTLVMVTPAVFPDRQSATFFNPSVLETPVKPSMIDLFIPANPFEALATGTIPAVVLFSILFGVALMGLQEKEGFLRNLNLVTQALTRVTMMVVKITPVGVFAMTAAAAGTMDISEFGRLQVYFTSYIGDCLFLTFIVFPLLVTTCTPFGYLQLLRKFKGALVMAFTTGNLFVVLPLLMEQTKELYLEDPDISKGGEYVDILVPVAFNFPNMGKLIALLFVLFGAWFVGAPVSPGAYPEFIATGWVTFFGGIDLALPFMLSLMGLPADLFQIYSVSGVINGRFATLLACMELICITLITGSWLARPHGLRVRLRALLPRAAAVIVLAALMLTSMRLILERVVPSVEYQAEQLASMHLPFHPDMKIAPPGTEPPTGRETRLQLFRKDRPGPERLRVGYIPENLPFSYFNKDNNLVGYDIELVCRLARDLKLELEFYPTSTTNMAAELRENRLDLVASGITLSESQIKELGFSEPYQKLVLGAVVSKQIKKQLDEADQKEIQQANLRIAMIKPNPYEDAFRAALPKAELIAIESYRAFYEADANTYDLLLTSMEAGSAWNMIYPRYTTMLLRDGSLKKEMVFACSPNNEELIRYVNDWLRLQQSMSTMDALYDYWFRGEPRSPEDQPPRWCILRNVLGWRD